MKLQYAFRFSIMVVKGHFNSFSPKHLPKKILFAVKPATKIFDSDDVIADGQKNFDLHIAIWGRCERLRRKILISREGILCVLKIYSQSNWKTCGFAQSWQYTTLTWKLAKEDFFFSLSSFSWDGVNTIRLTSASKETIPFHRFQNLFKVTSKGTFGILYILLKRYRASQETN